MHELSVCQGLLREVTRVAEAHGASRVTEILVAVGPLSGVEAPLLERAFTIARMGTVAEGAALRIEETPVRVRCEACGAESDARSNHLVCAGCGDWRVTLRSGDELLLKSLELEEPETMAAETAEGGRHV